MGAEDSGFIINDITLNKKYKVDQEDVNAY